MMYIVWLLFFFSSRRRHTRLVSDWSSDVCSSDLWIGQLPRLCSTISDHFKIFRFGSDWRLMPGKVSAIALASVYASPAALTTTTFTCNFSAANLLAISASPIIWRKYGLPVKRELYT